jgi:hypothetical protein
MVHMPDLKQHVGPAHMPTVASVGTHTMGKSLFQYLRIKVHPDIREREWSQIIVKGHHCRNPPSRIPSIEKRDKPFNWQRPTTAISDKNVLELQCFPGRDYVEHYAAIVATYLSLNGQNPDIVRYHMPTRQQCMQPLIESNVRNMGPVDIAIIGYVHHLRRFAPGKWEGGEDDQLFAWQTLTMPNGTKVGFIGCRICFWGDIGGNVVRVLQRLNHVKCAIYIGKLGSLRPEHRPNSILATGNCSMVKGTMVSWNNVLQEATRGSKIVRQGVHHSLPSVLDETKSWFEERKDTFDWVEPEIGHMATASLEGGTQFGYLHIVSDNLAQKYEYDLSNERLREVVEDRKRLTDEIQNCLSVFFSSWDA